MRGRRRAFHGLWQRSGALGFTDIETASFYGQTAPEFRRRLDTAGLTCSSIITGYDLKVENFKVENFAATA